MLDLPISEGCERLGVWFMNDAVSQTMQDKINVKADKIFSKAQKEFDNYLKANGYGWINGIITRIPDFF